MMMNCPEATIATGHIKDNMYIYQKYHLFLCSDTGLPSDFRRLQFTIKIRFAMTINKAQGQRLELRPTLCCHFSSCFQEWTNLFC
jgi:hypothetical protein